jgi:hypothetical protein
MRQSLSLALLLAAGLFMYGCGGESRHPPTSPTAPAAAVAQPPDPPAPEPLPFRTVRGSVQDLDGLPLVGVKVTTAYSAVSYTDAAGMYSVAAGSISGTISAVDQGAWTGEPYDSEWCAPCKTIRLRSDSQRSLIVELRWPDGAPLQMWIWTGRSGFPSEVVTPMVADGAMLASLRFVAIRGETIVHVGFADPYPSPVRVLSHPVSFTLSAVPQ